MNINVFYFNTHRTAENGALSVIEGNKDIPLDIKRVYYIYGEKSGAHRGFHAHKTLRQILFCPSGSIKMLLDDGKEKLEILLDRPEKGLLLDCVVWREMVWIQDDSVLCVLASEYYDEKDYIRSYDEFLRYVSE